MMMMMKMMIINCVKCPLAVLCFQDSAFSLQRRKKQTCVQEVMSKHISHTHTHANFRKKIYTNVLQIYFLLLCIWNLFRCSALPWCHVFYPFQALSHRPFRDVYWCWPLRAGHCCLPELAGRRLALHCKRSTSVVDQRVDSAAFSLIKNKEKCVRS